MEASWVKSIRAQCRAAKVPFFFKQWGGVRKSAAGRDLDGRTYDEFPDAPTKPVPSPADRAQLLDSLAVA
jgi:protein gp37